MSDQIREILQLEYEITSKFPGERLQHILAVAFYDCIDDQPDYGVYLMYLRKLYEHLNQIKPEKYV